MAIYIAFQGGTALSDTGPYKYQNVRVSTIPVDQALNDESNSATPFTLSAVGFEEWPDYGGPTALSGDAAWADTDVGALTDAAYTSSAIYGDSSVTIKGLSQGSTYWFEFFSSNPVTDRILHLKINGGAEYSQDQPGGVSNDSETILVTGVVPDVNGEATIDIRSNSPGNVYLPLMRFAEEVPVPEITVDQAELVPGGTISGSYSNYDTVPTTLTVSDGANTVTIASPTINDNGDGTGTFSGTMPSLPSSGTANLVLFGDVTVELS